MAAGMLRYWLFAGVASSVFVALETQAGEERANETCPGRVVIRAQDHQTEDLICKAVELARELLEPCGLTQTRPINVQTVSEMDEKHEACVAYFDCETDSLTVLAPSAIPVSGEVISVLSQLPEDEYFQSVIVHEMTHAFAHQSYPNGFSRVAHEYLAYAMQIASLSAESRASALEAFQVSEATALGGVDEIGLLFGPSQFALSSYEHFWRPENRCRIIDRIVSSDPRLPHDFLSEAPD